MYERNLIPNLSVAGIVATYQQAQKEITKAFGLLDQAKKRLKLTGIEDNVLEINARDYDLHRKCQDTITMLRQHTWRFIIGKCNIKEYLSSSRSLEIESQLRDDQLPEIEIETVREFISNLATGAPDLLMEFIYETFNLLRPRNSEYKTNTEYEIKEKVILNYLIDNNYGFVTISYNGRRELTSQDNCFHLLDGRGVAKYPEDAVTKINEAIGDKKWDCETEYFAFRWYKKGSLHIRLKRLDLVRCLNKLAGGNSLKSK